MYYNNQQKGVSLIITFFIMIIILVVVLSVSLLLYSEIKLIRNMGNSMVSLYAADSGVEKVLFYDRQVIPEGAERGLCSMLGLDYCVPDPSPGNLAVDHSIYCNNPITTPLADEGCDPDTCDNCTISFDTDFGAGKASYHVDVTVDPTYYLKSDSRGTFGDASREIEITALQEQQ